MKSLLKKIIPAKIRRAIRAAIYGDEKVSEGYIIIENPDRETLKKQFEDAWKDASIPGKQLRLTAKQMGDVMAVAPYRAFIELVRKTNLKNPTILEIGCSTGYYAEVLERAGVPARYTGCDYSPEFIARARENHPGITFDTCPATQLPYKDKSFDIAVSGCCILHIVDYEKAIAETGRVASGFAIFHRTPTLHERKTTFVTKKGYGVPMLEILFNETELLDLFARYGLSVVAVNTHGSYKVPGITEPVFSKSYLCVKVPMIMSNTHNYGNEKIH